MFNNPLVGYFYELRRINKFYVSAKSNCWIIQCSLVGGVVGCLVGVSKVIPRRVVLRCAKYFHRLMLIVSGFNQACFWIVLDWLWNIRVLLMFNIMFHAGHGNKVVWWCGGFRFLGVSHL
jgi:hypothetical protein